MSDQRTEELTNEDSPEVDEGEKGNICELLEREDERKEVVWYTLRETIHGVEGVAGVRCRHDPLVMRFVQGPVNFGMMQPPVDPVYAQIGEGNEQWKLKKIVKSKWSIGRSIVEVSIATNFKQEQGRGEDCH